MKTLFYPPRLNPLLVRFLQIIAPYGLRWFYQLELIVNEESLAKVKSLNSDNFLISPNHPTFQDPIVIFALSGKLGKQFHYLAAYELFQGLLAWFLPHIGVYSLRRGLADRSSIKETIAILNNPQSSLVVFPEGGCSFQNDTVMPFRIGCLQMAFQALNQTFKQGKPLPDLYVIPVSLKYKYTQNMESEIALTLQKLEQTLNLIPPSNLTPYQRLRLIAEQILNAIEQDYELSTPEIQTKILSGTERIERLRIKILEHCEQQLGFKTNPQDMVRERTYKLENFLKTQIEKGELSSVDFEFDLSTAQSANQSATSLQLMEKSLKRLLNFDAIYDGYVADNPSPERFLDTLIRLEREVFDIDQPPPKGFRQVFVKIGTPINLKNIFLEYQHSPEAKGVNSTSRNEVIEQLTRKIQQEVQNNLDQINQEIYQLS